jgi:hypothetical protein
MHKASPTKGTAVSQKIKITPLMELEAEVTVMNDRNASVAMVNLFDQGSGEVVASTTGASKREQGDTYCETVAVKLAVGRALQKMSRAMISEANKEVKAAMVAAEIKEAEKVQAAYDHMADLRSEFDQRADYDRDRVMSFPTIDEVMSDADARDKSDEEFISGLMALLGMTPDGQEDSQPPLPFVGDDDALVSALANLAGNPFDGENLTADGVPTTADGTPVTALPESLRRTLAELGFKPHEVQIIDLDSLI